MFTPKCDLRVRFPLLWNTAGLLIAGLAMAVPLLALSVDSRLLTVAASPWITNGMTAYYQLLSQNGSSENDWRNALLVRLAIMKGQQLDLQGDPDDALAEYQKALQANLRSSLANYRVAELLFNKRNYESSAIAYRFALRGDGDPLWTVVWSHIQLGKIFDITGQRERAVKEHQIAVNTKDNTRGALIEARRLLAEPYKNPETH